MSVNGHANFTGNVGIGVSVPETTLDVVGSTRLRGGAVVRSEENAVPTSNILRCVNDAGDVVLMVRNGGYAGVNNWASNVALTVASRSVDPTDFILFAENESGSPAFSVRNNGIVNVSGFLSKGGGSFKIDHPLDPENKYLSHSFVESPDMMNIYNGNAVTDAKGYAVVEMPDWFEALNRYFRYQLTVIGTFAQAIVAEKIKDRRFTIQTDKPNVEVSWQVTGIRQDAWANENRVPLEEDKTDDERGLLLHPAAFGQPVERGIHNRSRRVAESELGMVDLP